MCGDKDKFMELDEIIRDNITFVDHSKVVIKRKDESYQFIGDFYYIPMVKRNILSFG